MRSNPFNNICLNCKTTYRNTDRCLKCKEPLIRVRSDFEIPKTNSNRWKKLVTEKGNELFDLNNNSVFKNNMPIKQKSLGYVYYSQLKDKVDFHRFPLLYNNYTSLLKNWPDVPIPYLYSKIPDSLKDQLTRTYEMINRKRELI